MLPLTPPDYARRDAYAASASLARLNPRDEAYPLAQAAKEAAWDAFFLSTSLWDDACNHEGGEAETYRRRKASKEAAHEAARQRWKTDSFVRMNRYARRKIAYAVKTAAPIVAPATFREWRAQAREEAIAKADDAARDSLAERAPLVELP